MSTIAEEITRLQNAKAGIKSSIESRGVTVPGDATLDQYPGYVNSIPEPWEEVSGVNNSVVVKGCNNEAVNDHEVAVGTYNKSNTDTQFSVGVGTANNARSNALEVMGNGDVYINGVGDYDGTNAGGNNVKSIADYFTFLINWISLSFQRKNDVLYETDGTTGLLGLNTHSLELSSWQLQDLDFSPYRYAIAYIKQANQPASGTNSAYATPAIMVCIPLDAASKSTRYDAYIGSAGGTNPNDPDVHFNVICAIDSTKTKFAVESEHSIAGTILGDRNTDGRYCYKIEGVY